MKSIMDSLKKYKEQKSVYSGNDSAAFKIPRISTGIFTIDLMTGGGIPVNRMTEFYGAKSSGKSTVALKTIGTFLAANPTQHVLYVDFEHTYDDAWGSLFIAPKDMLRFHVVVPDTGEEGVNITVALINNARELGLVVIDSIGMMTPTGEIKADAEDSTVGLQAKLVNRLIRQMIHAIGVRKKVGLPSAFLALNQLRARIGKGGGFQSPTIKPGGYYQDFVHSLELRFYYEKFIKVRDIPIRAQHSFTLEKNKLGLNKRTERFYLYLVEYGGHKKGEFDELDQIFEYAKRCGLIQKKGTGWAIGTTAFKSMDSIKDYLKSNPKDMQKLKETTLNLCINNIMLTGEEGKGEEIEDSE